MAMGMGFMMRVVSEYYARTATRGSRPNHIESLSPTWTLSVVICDRNMFTGFGWGTGSKR